MDLREFYKNILSQDYERLWELVLAGNEVVVFLHDEKKYILLKSGC